jgi:hypothetical protein
LYGNGLPSGHGIGASGFTGMAGALRVGELRRGSQGPKHALKFIVYAKQDLYKCTTAADCYRWPASSADNYAVGWYGTVGNNTNTAMKMGALLAIPTSTDINSLGLETEAGRELAWTLQNYGAYITDDTYGASFGIISEDGPNGSFATQFQSDYGLPFEERVNDNTAWSRDVQRLNTALSVVNNNSSTSIGGGGTPLQPLAPEIAP